ncbi:MAG: CHAT domain-containing protein [Methanothrix sp.]|jgi:WD40 repeat protein|uniref:nSTAND1 domain-containing NTPase n=4 Tax=Methanothrix sp. TaxID=90426 RepID=UPI001BD5A266
MPSEAKKPVIFLAFANERNDQVGYLRNLPQEARNIRKALDLARRNKLCDVVERSNSTLKDILEVFQDPEYRNRIAVFHYGGHANGYQLLLESAEGSTVAAHAGGLASFLGQQTGLELVFLNGCATQNQAQGLLDANVSTVIATSQAIDDRVAAEFASRFYRSLAGGASIQGAYNEAKYAIQAEHGEDARDLYVEGYTPPDLPEDRFPWHLYKREGAELAAEWNLPEAVGDPLFGLPPIPAGDLPPSPFRHLSWFAREHAEVFFGRGYEIRDLYQRVIDRDSAPIILFYGQSGVGKSSVLAAGLIPRLEKSHEVHYLRRDGEKGLLGTLKEALSKDEGMTISESWLAQESKSAKPLIIILDQVEEAFTRPNPDLPHELEDFWGALETIFSDPGHRPQGKLILGFRKEWLAEIEKKLRDRKTPFSRLLLERLTRRGIIESVNGPAKSERLRQKYRLAVEDGLAEIIADNLQEDRESAIAPAMQILLTKMWERATELEPDHPEFNKDLYQTLKKKGILLQDFLEQQLASLEKQNSEVVNSGLALDFLDFHTTPLGTSEERTEEVLQKNYRYQSQVIDPLVKQCVDLYLLERVGKAAATRLSHDTLAPLVKQLFATSDRPGQRARRILESRSVDWKDGKEGAPLDETDLELVERGKDGMRAWDEAEERLVEASREERERKRKGRRIQRILGAAAILLIIIFAALAYYQMGQANEKTEEALALFLASQSTQKGDSSASDHTAKVLLAVESLLHKETVEGDHALRSSIALMARPLAQLAHDGPVWAMAFSPDGSRALAGGVDGTARIWDVSSGQKYLQLNHDGPVLAVVFSPDGSRALTGGVDGTARIWDASSGQEVHRLAHDDSVWAVVFSPDGSRALTGSDDGTARIWDASSGQEVHKLPHDSSVWTVAFSLDGSKVLTGSDDGTARIWDASSGREVHKLAHDGPVLAVVFSPDGSRVLTGSDDGTARIWDVSSGREVYWLAHDDSVRAVAFSPDGSKALTGSDDGTARIWDASSGQEVHRLVHHGWVGAVAFSPDGSKALTGSYDRTARIWDVSSGQEVHRLDHGDWVRAVAFNLDGSKALTGSDDGTAWIWDASSGREVHRLDHHGWVGAVAFSPDGLRVLTGSRDGTARIWDASSGREVHRLDHADRVQAVAFSPDGSRVLTGSNDGTSRIWDASSGQEVHKLPHDSSVWTVAFSLDGSKVLTGGLGGTAWIWDASSGQEVHRLDHDRSVRAVAFSLDGSKALTGSRDGTARIWDASSGQECHRLDHGDWVRAVAFSPDGSKALTGSRDGTARIWDASSGQECHRLAHSDWVGAVAFSSDGSKALTGSDDRTARIWDASSGQECHRLAHDGPVRAVAFSSDGSKALTSSDDGTARIWDVSSGQEYHRLPHDGPVLAVAFSPDGSKALTGSDDGTAWIWPVSYEDLIKEACGCVAENLSIEDWEGYRIANVRTCPREGSFNRSIKTRLLTDPIGLLSGEPECQPCIAEAFRSRN